MQQFEQQQDEPQGDSEASANCIGDKTPKGDGEPGAAGASIDEYPPSIVLPPFPLLSTVEIRVHEFLGLPEGSTLPAAALQLVEEIRSALVDPEVAALLMQPDTLARNAASNPAYEGLTFADVDAIVLKPVFGKVTTNLPDVVRNKERVELVFYFDGGQELMKQVRASIRALLAQPAIEMDFETTRVAEWLYSNSEIPNSVIEVSRDLASWRDQHFLDLSGPHSVVRELPEPVRVQHPQGNTIVYTHYKIRGMVHEGGILQPTGEEHCLGRYGGDLHRADLDRSGRYVSEPLEKQHGLFSEAAARREAEFCAKAWALGLTLDLPLEVGRCRDRRSRGEPLSTVTYLMVDDGSRSRFTQLYWKELLLPVMELLGPDSTALGVSGVTDLLSRGGLDAIRFGMHALFMEYGRLLDQCNKAGIYWPYPHFADVKRHRGNDRLFATNFTGAEYFGDQPTERKVGYRALTLALATAYLPQIPPFGDMRAQTKLMDILHFNPFVSIMMGYFSDRLGDRRLYPRPEPSGDRCHPSHRWKILKEGNAPLHELNLPEISLLWEKVREDPAPRPNLPPPVVFFAPGGMEVKRVSPGFLSREVESQMNSFMQRGISWFSLSTIPRQLSHSLHQDTCSLRMVAPEALPAKHLGDVVSSLMRHAWKGLA